MSKRLSIAYVFDSSYRPGEGVASYIRTLGQYYTSLGHDVHYLVGESSFNDPNIHSFGHMKTLHINGNSVDIPLPITSRQVDGVLKEVRPDILHIQMPYTPFFGGRFVRKAPKAVAVVGTFHIVPNSRAVTLGSSLLGLATRNSRSRIDKSISVSAAAQAFAASAFGVSSEVIACPININNFSVGQRLSEYDDGKINIVFMGRLDERKGCSYLLTAVNGLDRGTRSKIRVLIAGKGPLMNDLIRQSSESGLDDIVTFLGFVDETDKPNVLASADIAVFPSTGGESFGITLLEAMASGAGVVIGGDNVGYRQVLDSNANFLFNPKDTVSFTNKLKELISDPSMREQLHTRQQKLVRQYDVSVIGPQILDIYHSVL